MDTLTPRDLHAPGADLWNPKLAMEVPTWAQGILRSRESAQMPVGTLHADAGVQNDFDSGLQFISVQGFHVIAIEQPNNESVRAALNLLKRLRRSPLDVGALAFGDEVRVSAKSINQLARIGVMVSRNGGKNALAQANAAVAQYLALQLLGHNHLRDHFEHRP